ncbi:hypothetical protein ISN76_08000 [Dyella halodurans]|uniref:Uncharacterized protein n=1 Tax=Dyella halodurans TaxID=1920171 RepID=A0ABV9C473_9GAMM|nr:hypothetical protein [Dyella halodurans]
MSFEKIQFGEKEIFCGSLGDSIPDAVPRPFAVLFPAFSEQDRRKGMLLLDSFLERGCGEFQCAGKEAEVMHDDMDGYLEKNGWKRVLTTFDDNVVNACEYHVFGVGKVSACLVALVADYPEVVSHLKRFAAQCEG